MNQEKKEIEYVDVNSADAEAMAQVPRLSRTLADAIVAGRPFQKLEELLKVRGMGEKLLAQVKPHLKLSPLDVNRASVEELCALERFPRLLAERIVEGRPYASLESIRKVRGMGPRLYEQYSPYLYASQVEKPLQPPEPAAVVEAPPPTIETAVPEPVVMNKTPLPAVESAETSAEGSAAKAQPEPVIAVGPTTSTQSVFYPPEEPPKKEAERGAGFFRRPDWSRAIQIITPDVPPFSGERTQTAPRTVRSETLLWAGGIGLLVLILSILFNMALLAIFNGGLHYAARDDMLNLQSQVNALDSQARALQQDVEGLRTRLDNMEALSGRIGILEEEQSALQEEMDAASQQVQAMQEQVDSVNQQISDIQQRTTAFEQFLDGLSSLLQGIWPVTP